MPYLVSRVNKIPLSLIEYIYQHTMSKMNLEWKDLFEIFHLKLILQKQNKKGTTYHI